MDVQHTYYRTESSGKGENHRNQLDTVYFAVPKRLFDTYGKLQRIKAEWYEFKTKDYVVTSNSEFYNAVQSYLGKIVPSSNGKVDTIEPVLNDDIGYALANGMETISAWLWVFDTQNRERARHDGRQGREQEVFYHERKDLCEAVCNGLFFGLFQRYGKEVGRGLRRLQGIRHGKGNGCGAETAEQLFHQRAVQIKNMEVSK